MKPSKLDKVIILVIVLCVIAVGAVAILSDPANQSPRVAYLYPAFGGVQNVWMTDIDAPENQRQLTFSEYGIYDYDVSADGRWLAFAEKTPDLSAQIRLLDIPANRVINLVDCVALSAYCTTPAFSPDGTRLAYQRSELASNGYGVSRIWLVDLTRPSYDTIPLIKDTQVVGHTPIWSQDNNTLAFYSADTTQPGILIFDFVPRTDNDVQLRFIPSSYGVMGTVSPNGQEIIFPEIVRRSDQLFTHLRIANLIDKEFAAFTDPEGPTDDVAVQWSPDGQTVALARKYTDDRWTIGHQLYLQDTSSTDENLQAIDFNEHYNTSYFRWNQAGNRLVMQRFPLENADGTPNRNAVPEIWVYDLDTNEASNVMENAFLPQWASP